MREILKNQVIVSSAPCRIDFGGTLDIRTFHYPLGYLSPCTFNIALDMRTVVRLEPYDKGYVRIASQGFEPAEFILYEAPFDHPLGLMFAIAAFFRAESVSISIESASPPRSALGGSSVAAVALIGALSFAGKLCGRKELSRRQIVLLAHAIEETVAGVPCGIQDQLAAMYGGVNAWYWPYGPAEAPFRRKPLLGKTRQRKLMENILVAYCGIPHESRDINGRWVRQFLKGEYRGEWMEIIGCTKKFIDSLSEHNYKGAALAMQRETALRCRMTPDVLDEVGQRLLTGAEEAECGARFAGAGGGGCVWAIGESRQIRNLKPIWEKILGERPNAGLLNVGIDSDGWTAQTI